MGTRIYASDECLNTFFIDGRAIDNFYFYNDGKIIAHTKWFGNNRSFHFIDFPFEIKKAKKGYNLLERKDAFYILNESNDYGKYYNVYIHTSLVELEFLKSEIYSSSWYSINSQDVFSIKLHGMRRNLVGRRDDGRPRYEWKEDDYIEKFPTNFNSEKTKEWDKCEKMAKEMSEVMMTKLSAYDIHNLLESYNVTKKRVRKEE